MLEKGKKSKESKVDHARGPQWCELRDLSVVSRRENAYLEKCRGDGFLPYGPRAHRGLAHLRANGEIPLVVPVSYGRKPV